MKKIGCNGLFIILFFKLSLLVIFLLPCSVAPQLCRLLFKYLDNLNIKKSKVGKLIVSILWLCIAINTSYIVSGKILIQRTDLNNEKYGV